MQVMKLTSKRIKRSARYIFSIDRTPIYKFTVQYSLLSSSPI